MRSLEQLENDLLTVLAELNALIRQTTDEQTKARLEYAKSLAEHLENTLGDLTVNQVRASANKVLKALPKLEALTRKDKDQSGFCSRLFSVRNKLR
ncbi:hypothetical protein VPEG_00114 [Vibrio phage SIO-2]|uniref:hypothetical protein n=1 Tax=Vibrio phage SIO-2 TaxID=700512 RepID=UPI0002357C97|nr:hypothetical protein VPEG_00114 [Vibrio phage SIO-2]AET42264.1 hypothetical protein VPEG_00114 [Vibrio phage SIO-2]QKE60688.1 hypothetical protein vBVhaSVHB1_1 [Vibrio phage vB_VhaS-VHB1]